ncbi:unnamed protein product [Amoebophrya sp. A120]|nr:unnamed protein product [Amoebophrya sp. A120]|eukprot:GSA120T00002821001.1
MTVADEKGGDAESCAAEEAATEKTSIVDFYRTKIKRVKSEVDLDVEEVLSTTSFPPITKTTSKKSLLAEDPHASPATCSTVPSTLRRGSPSCGGLSPEVLGGAEHDESPRFATSALRNLEVNKYSQFLRKSPVKVVTAAEVVASPTDKSKLHKLRSVPRVDLSGLLDRDVQRRADVGKTSEATGVRGVQQFADFRQKRDDLREEEGVIQGPGAARSQAVNTGSESSSRMNLVPEVFVSWKEEVTQRRIAREFQETLTRQLQQFHSAEFQPGDLSMNLTPRSPGRPDSLTVSPELLGHDIRRSLEKRSQVKAAIKRLEGWKTGAAVAAVRREDEGTPPLAAAAEEEKIVVANESLSKEQTTCGNASCVNEDDVVVQLDHEAGDERQDACGGENPGRPSRAQDAPLEADPPGNITGPERVISSDVSNDTNLRLQRTRTADDPFSGLRSPALLSPSVVDRSDEFQFRNSGSSDSAYTSPLGDLGGLSLGAPVVRKMSSAPELGVAFAHFASNCSVEVQEPGVQFVRSELEEQESTFLSHGQNINHEVQASLVRGGAEGWNSNPHDYNNHRQHPESVDIVTAPRLLFREKVCERAVRNALKRPDVTCRAGTSYANPTLASRRRKERSSFATPDQTDQGWCSSTNIDHGPKPKSIFRESKKATNKQESLLYAADVVLPSRQDGATSVNYYCHRGSPRLVQRTSPGFSELSLGDESSIDTVGGSCRAGEGSLCAPLAPGCAISSSEQDVVLLSSPPTGMPTVMANGPVSSTSRKAQIQMSLGNQRRRTLPPASTFRPRDCDATIQNHPANPLCRSDNPVRPPPLQRPAPEKEINNKRQLVPQRQRSFSSLSQMSERSLKVAAKQATKTMRTRSPAADGAKSGTSAGSSATKPASLLFRRSSQTRKSGVSRSPLVSPRPLSPPVYAGDIITSARAGGSSQPSPERNAAEKSTLLATARDAQAEKIKKNLNRSTLAPPIISNRKSCVPSPSGRPTAGAIAVPNAQRLAQLARPRRDPRESPLSSPTLRTSSPGLQQGEPRNSPQASSKTSIREALQRCRPAQERRQTLPARPADTSRNDTRSGQLANQFRSPPGNPTCASDVPLAQVVEEAAKKRIDEMATELSTALDRVRALFPDTDEWTSGRESTVTSERCPVPAQKVRQVPASQTTPSPRVELQESAASTRPPGEKSYEEQKAPVRPLAQRRQHFGRTTSPDRRIQRGRFGKKPQTGRLYVPRPALDSVPEEQGTTNSISPNKDEKSCDAANTAAARSASPASPEFSRALAAGVAAQLRTVVEKHFIVQQPPITQADSNGVFNVAHQSPGACSTSTRYCSPADDLDTVCSSGGKILDAPVALDAVRVEQRQDQAPAVQARAGLAFPVTPPESPSHTGLCLRNYPQSLERKVKLPERRSLYLPQAGDAVDEALAEWHNTVSRADDEKFVFLRANTYSYRDRVVRIGFSSNCGEKLRTSTSARKHANERHRTEPALGNHLVVECEATRDDVTGPKLLLLDDYVKEVNSCSVSPRSSSSTPRPRSYKHTKADVAEKESESDSSPLHAATIYAPASSRGRASAVAHATKDLHAVPQLRRATLLQHRPNPFTTAMGSSTHASAAPPLSPPLSFPPLASPPLGSPIGSTVFYPETASQTFTPVFGTPGSHAASNITSAAASAPTAVVQHQTRTIGSTYPSLLSRPVKIAEQRAVQPVTKTCYNVVNSFISPRKKELTSAIRSPSLAPTVGGGQLLPTANRMRRVPAATESPQLLLTPPRDLHCGHRKEQLTAQHPVTTEIGESHASSLSSSSNEEESKYGLRPPNLQFDSRGFRRSSRRCRLRKKSFNFQPWLRRAGIHVVCSPNKHDGKVAGNNGGSGLTRRKSYAAVPVHGAV